jgi:pSer/pThr/pTyr-binding forkhead associated (FHA) protein/DNA-binding protein Fis
VSSASVPTPVRRHPAAALVLRIAGRSGPTFVLDPDRDNTLGRSPEASIVVADRLASRTHAALRFDAAHNSWTLHDLGSRNGTLLDGVVVTSSAIADGAIVRVGTSELVFKTLPPAADPGEPADRTQFVRCSPVSELEGSVLRRSSQGSTDDARRPVLLYQASIRLLASRSVREVIEATLELAAEHSGAASVGWFRVIDADRLEPVCVVPPASALATLVGEATARLVAREGNAVWVASSRNPAATHDTEPEIACVPIVEGDRVHAALVASAAAGTLRSADFDFLVALSSLASAACAGHAGPPPNRNAPVVDLGSLQTVGLDALAMLDADADATSPEPDATLLSGTISLDEQSLRQIAAPGAEESPVAARIGSFVAETSTLRLEDWQRILVVEALRRTGGSVPNAAAELGISRATLYRKLEVYGLTR